MNIIIPLGGKGERFLQQGYNEPKPLISIFNKPMIFYVLENLKFEPNDEIYIIYYLISNDFENRITSKFPFVKFVKLTKQTLGAAETIKLGLETILPITKNKKTVILDCDTFYTTDILSIYRNTPKEKNAVFYTKNTETNHIYSYIQLEDENNKITKIIEKEKISDNANTGVYCFCDVNELYKYACHIIDNQIMFKNEYYISCIIAEYIKNSTLSTPFFGIQIDSKNVFNLGTPEQVNTYKKNTHLFLFDLDGTLVLTENIYYDVWTEILNQYKIQLTPEIFNNYISGQTDESVILKLIPNIITQQNILPSLSNIKDDLFLKNLDKITLIDGIFDFLSTIKQNGHKIALVTNCNRRIAEAIIDYFKFNCFFEYIVIGNECKNPKPYPDPYKKAITLFDGKQEQTIIFEDSKTGLLSAQGCNPKCIVGIETIYTSEELLENFANITIKDFTMVSLTSILSFQTKTNNDKLKDFIKNSLPYEIFDINIKYNKLKGGFISDVIDVSYKHNQQTIHAVLKLENTNQNFLTKMSQSLELFNREYYFYETISKYVPLQIPSFYGITRDENFNNIGILMENLNIKKQCTIGIDLNKSPLQTSLNIINNIAKMHAKFWNKPIENQFKELKRNNHPIFQPFWSNFIKSHWYTFKEKWGNVLSKEQLLIGEKIVEKFETIQNSLSTSPLTLIHGDVKSANIFFKETQDLHNNGHEPIFIDWQYIAYGKGVQDLVFFMIESFEPQTMKTHKTLFKEYYYHKLCDFGVKNYSKDEYENDFVNASYYFPFFVSQWFGTINEDELIDKNFPFFFIQRLFHFYIC